MSGLIAYGIVLLGLVTALGGLYWWVDDNGYDRATQELTPVIKKLETARDAEIAANDQLRSDFDRLGAAVKSCSADVKRIEAAGIEAKAAAEAAVVAANARNKGLQAKIGELQRQAAIPSTKPKEAQCETATAILRDLAGRMREQ